MFLDFKCLITLTQVLLLSPQILTETLWDGGGGGWVGGRSGWSKTVLNQVSCDKINVSRLPKLTDNSYTIV